MFVRPAGRISSLIALVALSSVVVLVAKSQPSPSGGKRVGDPPQEQAQRKDAPTAQQDPGTNAIGVALRQSDKEKQNAARAEAEELERAALERKSFWLSAIMVLVTATGVLVVGWQAWESRKAAEAARSAAQSSERSIAAMQQTERAYVVLSHRTEPRSDMGSPAFETISFQSRTSGDTDSCELHFTIEIHNAGRTPAHILGGGVWHRTTGGGYPHAVPPLAPPLQYPVTIPPAFIVPGDRHVLASFVLFPSTSIELVQTGMEYLWLMGQIDYRDVFGQRHRTGYGRWYFSPTGELNFDASTNAMNYDRLMTDEDERQRQEASEFP
jgi:hypothetical protein